MIVMPGMINNHRHAWEGLIRGAAAGFTFGQYFQRILPVVVARSTPRDAYLGTLLSSYEALYELPFVLKWKLNIYPGNMFLSLMDEVS